MVVTLFSEDPMARRGWFFVICLATALFLVFGCTRGQFDGDLDVDTWNNPGGEGPEVLVLTDHEPPLMPWPNDIATKEDSTTVTGRRINVDKGGDTDFNRMLRKEIRKLDGFGVSSAITVSFDKALALATITNDNIYIINIQKDSPRFGERHMIDFENEFLPYDLEKPESFYANDKNAENVNLLLGMNNRVQWYEDETNTILMRPLTPLAESSKYAVVLTRNLLGMDSAPVRPPDDFDYITFPNMLHETETAVNYLTGEMGVDLSDIAFVWSFTTQTIAKPLETLRSGIRGEGPFAYLAAEFPPQISVIHKFGVETDQEEDEYVLGGDFFTRLFSVIDPLMGEGSFPLNEMLNMDNVDYIVSGSYTTPYFLGNDEGYFIWNWETGDAEYGEEEVTFFISVPKPTEANGYAQPPYPVTFFQHANIRNRLDSWALADALAKKGIATIGIDAAEHGPELYLFGIAVVLQGLIPPPQGIAELGIDLVLKILTKLMYPSYTTKGLTTQELYDQLFAKGTFFGTALLGRSKDEDGDGIIEGGNSFYSADIFRTKAITMQTLVDLFLGVKVVQNLCTDWNGDEILSREEGDFNQDGVCDVGGKYDDGVARPVRFAGMSLGSIIGASFVALEKEINTAVLNVPGGILTDILQRNKIPNVNEAIRKDLLGPLVVGRLTPEGRTALTFNMDSMENYFAMIDVYPNARVVLTNLDTEDTRWKTTDENGNFAISIASDVGDWLGLQIVTESGKVVENLTWAQEFRGLGVERNTPVARAFVETAQWGIDGVDPINFAPYFTLHPRPGNSPKRVLMQLCMPDTAVPTSAGLALARAAGFIDLERQTRLKELGIFDFGYSLFVEANLPVQSRSESGWRIHPGAHHEYMLAPRPYENAMMYSFVAKEQAAIFLATDGGWIEDNVNVMVPPEFLFDGY